MTHDIADDGFHEIQLSGKQLVFLFMATTAVSVMIFLLGVLVGRDVRGGRVSEATEAALTTPAPSPASTPNQVYKVQVGRYDDKNEAERVAKRLEKEEKFSPWISR